MSECVVRMPDMRCNMAYHAGLRGVLTCPVTKKKCCGQAEIHCPILCALPEGHGRLVDADALIGKVKQRVVGFMQSELNPPTVVCEVFERTKGDVCELIDHAPTIVPAERRANDEAD